MRRKSIKIAMNKANINRVDNVLDYNNRVENNVISNRNINDSNKGIDNTASKIRLKINKDINKDKCNNNTTNYNNISSTAINNTHTINNSITSLKNKAKARVALKSNEYLRRFKNEIISIFESEEMKSIPAGLLFNSIFNTWAGCPESGIINSSISANINSVSANNTGSAFIGDTIKIINNNIIKKQKVSLKIGETDFSIGEYDSKIDGDLLQFLNTKYVEKKANIKK